MTRRLKIFAVFAALWAGIYCAALLPLVTRANARASRSGAAAALVVLFTCALTGVETACLRREDIRASRRNLRVQYSIVSVAAVSPPVAMWAFAIGHNPWLFLAGEAIAVAGAVLALVAASRRTIKGIRKEELFR